jgi:hypothetical protein
MHGEGELFGYLHLSRPGFYAHISALAWLPWAAELWKLVTLFKEKYQGWMYGPLFSFDLEELETSVPTWLRTAARLAKDLRGAPQKWVASWQ